MRLRSWLGICAASIGALAATASVPAAGYLAAIPLAVASAAIVWLLVDWPLTRRHLPWAAGAVAAASLGATVTALATASRGGRTAGTLGMLEVMILLVLLSLAVRWAPQRQAVILGSLTAIAAAMWILRFLPDPTPLTVVGALALWSIGPAAATVAGGYPRIAQARQQQSIRAARQAQRLELARDLHDFVAHDVTGIVVQAQAAQVAGRDDPRVAFNALKRIEEAGLHALTSMDRAVHTLRDSPSRRELAVPDLPRPGLGELTALLDRFSAAGQSTALTVNVDARLVEVLPHDVSSAAYRVVVEALTNVRRHAPTAANVAVAINRGPDGTALVVSVTNDLPATTAAPTRGRGGSGLAELIKQVRALGGQLSGGPAADCWQVTATLPLPDATRT